MLAKDEIFHIVSPGHNQSGSSHPFCFELECFWTFEVPTNHHVSLHFTSYELRSENDFFEIFDGDSNLLVQKCSEEICEDARSTGSKMTLRFVSGRPSNASATKRERHFTATVTAATNPPPTVNFIVIIIISLIVVVGLTILLIGLFYWHRRYTRLR